MRHERTTAVQRVVNPKTNKKNPERKRTDRPETRCQRKKAKTHGEKQIAKGETGRKKKDQPEITQGVAEAAERLTTRTSGTQTTAENCNGALNRARQQATKRTETTEPQEHQHT